MSVSVVRITVMGRITTHTDITETHMMLGPSTDFGGDHRELFKKQGLGTDSGFKNLSGSAKKSKTSGNLPSL